MTLSSKSLPLVTVETSEGHVHSDLWNTKKTRYWYTKVTAAFKWPHAREGARGRGPGGGGQGAGARGRG